MIRKHESEITSLLTRCGISLQRRILVAAILQKMIVDTFAEHTPSPPPEFMTWALSESSSSNDDFTQNFHVEQGNIRKVKEAFAD